MMKARINIPKGITQIITKVVLQFLKAKSQIA